MISTPQYRTGAERTTPTFTRSKCISLTRTPSLPTPCLCVSFCCFFLFFFFLWHCCFFCCFCPLWIWFFCFLSFFFHYLWLCFFFCSRRCRWHWCCWHWCCCRWHCCY